eukprot:2197115-Rhodomonas_salina.3
MSTVIEVIWTVSACGSESKPCARPSPRESPGSRSYPSRHASLSRDLRNAPESLVSTAGSSRTPSGACTSKKLTALINKIPTPPPAHPAHPRSRWLCLGSSIQGLLVESRV